MKTLRRVVLGLVATLGLLYIPDCDTKVEPAEGEPFVWDQDAVWSQLHRRFDRARERGCHSASISIAERIGSVGQRVAALPEDVGPQSAELDAIEQSFFEVAADVAACPRLAPPLITLYMETRATLKDRSRSWTMNERAARNRLYRLLYGTRMAVEEVLLQMDPDEMPTLFEGRNEASESPSVEVRGVRVHSGDILVSRGGATTSAFIARGNDYPGNFSHVALVHVDEGTFQTIEAHIEIGVAVAGLETYEADPKLRVMLLRPRADLAAGDFAHRAATHALDDAHEGHIPYDFAMDYQDESALFCSEVASQAYRSQDIELWQGLTSMSSEGTARWLSRFGVRHFVTHGPSDLEYDPQLVVVAEWRNAESLWQDHLDSAVLDALLEGAARGDDVHYSRAMLPFARLLKAWSWIKNRFGAEGPIPEGMSATVALRVEWLREQHRRIKTQVEEAAESFESEQGYRPPYWELVRMANEANDPSASQG